MPGSNSRPNVSDDYMVTSDLPGRPSNIVNNIKYRYIVISTENHATLSS